MESERLGFAIDRERVAGILARFILSSEFERVDAQYGPDQDGDASVSSHFLIKDSAQITDEDIPRLSRFLSGVVSALYSADVGGFVYSRLFEAA